MMELLVNGTPYTGFIRASATVSLRTLANDFSFTASASNGYPAIKADDEIRVHVDGVRVLTGYVEEVSGDEAEGGHEVTYTGRDRTGDLIDSDIDIIGDIKASESLTLKRIIQIILAHLGLDIPIIEEFQPAPYNQAEDILAPPVGENAWRFIKAYALKRQALITSNGDGHIVITRAQAVDSGAIVQSLTDSDSNNVLSQSFSIKKSKQFRRYVRRGQLDPRALNFAGESTSKTIEDQRGIFTDNAVRAGRQQVVVENESYSSAQLRERALWAKQLSDAEAIAYKCSVPGHRNSAGELWTPNTLAQVNSTAADISRQMLLDAVTFSQGEGSVTASGLQFVEKNTYTTDAALLSQRPAGSQSDAFKALG